MYLIRHPIGQVLVLGLLIGCSSTRDLPPGEGVHPSGWIDESSDQFHGVFFANNGYDLGECRECHGDDYQGGNVEVSCSGADCHTGSPERCGTCHGDGDDPRPATAAHPAHDAFCDTCHPIPKAFEVPGHADGTVDLVFTGLATAAGSSPQWNGTSCSGAYCHVDGTPAWQDPGPLGCNDCHLAPPASHGRFERVAGSESVCVNCHADPAGTTHINGALDLDEPACNACHGGFNGVPPPALDGSTDPTTVGVGAHLRHTDPRLAGRIGRAVPCATCHRVPAAVQAAGHLDTSAPADVALPLGGIYDPADNTCVVACHFDRDPGPVWTDNSGAARACDACHDFPPLKTRAGTPHPPATGDQCADCHPFSVDTHVDGEVTLP